MDHSTTPTTPVVATRRRSLARIVATVVTAALAVGGLTVVTAAPASATVTDTASNATLSWGFNDYSKTWGVTASGDIDLNTPVSAAGGYVTSSGFSLKEGVGTITAAGLGTIDYDASVTYSPFAGYGLTTSSFTFSDFTLALTSATRGTLTADLTFVKPTVPAASPVEVTLANFDISSISTTGGELALTTAAPDFENTVAAGKYAAGYTDAWPTTLVDALLPSVGQDFVSYFYRTSNTATNDTKKPLPFAVTADVALPTITKTIVSQSKTGGYVLAVTGDGFRWSTKTSPPPADAGVYLGIAESGGGNSYTDIGSYAAVGNRFGEVQIPNGTFEFTLTAPTAKLDPTKSYSLYTWQAHTHSNTSQDTETPLDIDFDALATDPSTTAVAVSASTVAVGTDVTLTATVPAAATGTIEFFNGTTSLGSKTVADGSASFVVSGLSVGTASFTAKYSGDSAYRPSESAASEVETTKVATSVALSLSKSSEIYKKAAVTATATVAGATGNVAFVVGTKTVGTVPLVSGKAAFTLPSTYAAGKYSVKANYLGSDVLSASSSTASTLTITKATTSKVAVSGSKFKKNSKPKVTVKVAKLSNGAYPTGKVRIYIGGKLVKTSSINASSKGTIKVTLPKQKKTIKVKAFYDGGVNVTTKYSATVTIKRK